MSGAAGATPNAAPAQPSTHEYGGDEVSALVLDPGYSTTRAGFAGEDVPKSVIPTFYGSQTGDEGSAKLLFGDNAIHNPLANLDIRNPMSAESVVEDWETAKQLWEYAIVSRLTSAKPSDPIRNGLNDPSDQDGDVQMESTEEMEKPLSESPLLMTEPQWNPLKNREKSIEIAMEDWSCPAFFLGKQSVLSAFSAGKPTAIVIDVGASTTSVTPIVDGMVLRKGAQRSNIAGNFLSNQIRLVFQQMQPSVPLIPHYMVSSKQPVDAGAPSNAIYKSFAKPPTESFRKLQEERVLNEFKESVVQIWPGPGRFNEDAVRGRPGRPFEMPDGWNQVFGSEAYRASECLWDAKAALTDENNPAPKPEGSITAMIQAALAAIDVDSRPPLLNNVVVVGGSTLLYGFTDRLMSEISALYPGPRVRLQAPGNTAERKFASWIGGSILGSLGTFHQMWISKKEYDEHGANIVEKRCK